MTRKSKALRQQQTQDLLTLFENSILHQTMFNWDYRFIRDMNHKLSHSKKITQKQRHILDDKIEKGLPVIPQASPKAIELKQALETLPNHSSFSWTKRVGGEMLAKLNKGWNLSEKQMAMVERFIKESRDYRAQPPQTQEETERVQFLVSLASHYSPEHWYNCGKQGSYISKLTACINDGLKITSEDIKNGEFAVRGELKRWTKAQSFKPGALCAYSSSRGKRRGIILEGPLLKNHNGNPLNKIAFHILVEGEVIEFVDARKIKTR